MQGTLPPLCNAALASISRRGIDVPAYPRKALQASVVHLGLGAFNRAHQALVFDQLLAGGDTRWGVLGVATRSWALADRLAAQDGLYAVKLASAGGAQWKVIGALVQTCAATRDPSVVFAALANPATRWVTLTVTEKGYDPALAALLVEGLRRRRDAGHAGLTLASCDNLSHNGDKLKALCADACSDAALSEWIARQCRFPNSMVDRIVPAATPRCAEEAASALGVSDNAALFTETFWQWVIEDNFVEPADGRALSGAGVTVVPDVRPYENAKLRMLNGSHSALACLGALAGLPTVFDCISRPGIRNYIHQLMSLEVMPHLELPGLERYRDALLERFENPQLLHGVHQIASDSSQKIGLRWRPSILAQLQAGGPIQHHAFAAAAWMRYCLGQDDQGRPYAIHDPQAPLMLDTARIHHGNIEATVNAFLSINAIWGSGLSASAPWRDAVGHCLRAIHAHGSLQALQLVAGGRTGD